jgi:hypothetical protein
MKTEIEGKILRKINNRLVDLIPSKLFVLFLLQAFTLFSRLASIFIFFETGRSLHERDKNGLI